MHRFLFKSLLTFTLPLLLWSCQSQTATGPCEYTEEKFNMIIIDVIQKDDNENEFTVLVDFDGNVSYASETHTLEEIRNVKTDLDFVKSEGAILKKMRLTPEYEVFLDLKN